MPVAVIACLGGTIAAIVAGSCDFAVLAWILAILAIAGFVGVLFLIYAGGVIDQEQG
jgi:hypothetical protein